MHHLTKTLLTSLALTLAACDEPTDFGDDFGDGEIGVRPLGGFQLNTSFIGGHDYDELNLAGQFHKRVKLTKVCLMNGSRVCLTPGVVAPLKGVVTDTLWVENSELKGRRLDQVFVGADFVKSRWYVSLDHDRDGVIDSTIQLVLDGVKADKTLAPTPVGFWNYYWAYDSKTATGLLTKNIEQKDTPTPMCAVDPDTGSLGSVLLENTSIDTSPMTNGVVNYLANSMFVACHSGAAGKAPGGWGYVMHDLGRVVYTNVIRLIRGDYGNNGKSFTAPGQKLAVTDDLVVNKEYDPALKLEGLMSFDKGWLCIYQPRLGKLSDVLAVNPAIPVCTGKELVGTSIAGVVSNVMTQPVP